jgi:hypothetical protein
MTLRITYKTKNNQLDDFLDEFSTIQEAIEYMNKINERAKDEIILDIRPTTA